MANETNSSLGFPPSKQFEKTTSSSARMLETMTEADTETIEIIQHILNQVRVETDEVMKFQQEHDECVAQLVKQSEEILDRDVKKLTAKVLANSLDENRHNEMLKKRKKFIATITAQSDSDENEYFAVQEQIMVLKNKVLAAQKELKAVEEQLEIQRKQAEEEQRRRQQEQEEELHKRQAEDERKRKAEEVERVKKEEAERLRKQQEEEAARRRKAAEEKARQEKEEKARQEKEEKARQEKERLDKEAEQQRKAKTGPGQKRKRQPSASAEQHTPIKTRASANRLAAPERPGSPIWRQQQQQTTPKPPAPAAVAAKTPMKAANDNTTTSSMRTPTPPEKPSPPSLSLFSKKTQTPSTPKAVSKLNPPVVPETPRPGVKTAAGKQPAWMVEQLAQQAAKESANNGNKGTPATPARPAFERTGTAGKMDKTMDTDYDDDSFWDDD